ncbi:MAG: cellobiose phosphorylase [Candidatus Omnitrophica bacterium]|nr:cellobiose phosphorylase [Candidatus Omnitrophota bacterium]
MDKNKNVKYYLNKTGEFVIENYNFAKPFANFFPGIAGKYGIPIWVFYVNRGQGIISFGTEDKDHSILEFYPANKAWQFVTTLGFRSFIKIISGKKTVFYEPFHNGFTSLGFDIVNRMRLTSYDMNIEEENKTLGIKTQVEYFTVPNDCYSALARIVTLKNTSKTAKTLQFLDGIPQIVPYGVNNLFLKKLARTIEAWMEVDNMDKDVPFYKVDVDPIDRPNVVHIKQGNFFIGFMYENGKPVITKPIVDPQSIFGPHTDFSYPREYLAEKNFPYPKNQILQCKTPCAFAYINMTLKPGEEKIYYSLFGNMISNELLNETVPRITGSGYLRHKSRVNKQIIENLQSGVQTRSSSREFDLYAKQTYLDNIMRGGYPVIFGTEKKQTVFYLYSRKHGDLERDYNKFQVQSTFFSQGNGNYRDINQNRRCDIWFNPEVKDANIISFFNILQTDGFNPLVVKGAQFHLQDEPAFAAKLKELVEKQEDVARIMEVLEKTFTPGKIALFMEDNKVKLRIPHDEFLNLLLASAVKEETAVHGEGFWTDHWFYNLDLLDAYFDMYPENIKELVFEKRIFTYFDNAETVNPRSVKHILLDGKPRQLYSVGHDMEKEKMILKRSSRINTVRREYGNGEIYTTTLINKLLCLFANKTASLDPFGVGIEMEANKPDWFDALNGLPALFGSSSCETFELKRLIIFLQKVIRDSELPGIPLSDETRDFILKLGELLNEYQDNTSADKDYVYWDRSATLKEDFRRKTKFGVSGNETNTDTGELLSILASALKKVEAGLEKAFDKEKNIYYAYFMHEVSAYDTAGGSTIKPSKFIQKKIPFFLEAQVHALKLTGNSDKARQLYRAVKKSPLFDKKLKMYKVTASLKEMPWEIGRCRAFTPGWLENESIWLHMEYKYLLELLRCGLHEEFYEDFKNVLIPFQDPARYGRSTMENSSFLVSSAFPDKKLHGNGFVARLSGSTVEFINIWLLINIGEKPFSLNKTGELTLKLSPALAGWLFYADKKDYTYSFKFLSKIDVVYHNPKRKNTFGKNSVSVKKISFKDKNGSPIEINSDIIPAPYAEQIRSRQITKIEAHLG